MRIFRKYMVFIPTQYVVKNLPYSLDLIALTDSVLCAPEVTVKFLRRFPPRRHSLDKFDAILTIPRIFFDVTKLSLHLCNVYRPDLSLECYNETNLKYPDITE